MPDTPFLTSFWTLVLKSFNFLALSSFPSIFPRNSMEELNVVTLLVSATPISGIEPSFFCVALRVATVTASSDLESDVETLSNITSGFIDMYCS